VIFVQFIWNWPRPFVTNGYNTLGRVAAQTNANGASWSYFFAGYPQRGRPPTNGPKLLASMVMSPGAGAIWTASGSSIRNSEGESSTAFPTHA
jgi:hypothetical protein